MPSQIYREDAVQSPLEPGNAREILGRATDAVRSRKSFASFTSITRKDYSLSSLILDDAARWRRSIRQRNQRGTTKGRQSQVNDENGTDEDVDIADELTNEDGSADPSQGYALDPALPPALAGTNLTSPRNSLEFGHTPAPGTPGSLPLLQSPSQRRVITASNMSDLDTATATVAASVVGSVQGSGTLAWGPGPTLDQQPPQRRQSTAEGFVPLPPGYPNAYMNPHPPLHSHPHSHPRVATRLHMVLGAEGPWAQPPGEAPAVVMRSPKGVLSGAASPTREYLATPTTPGSGGSVSPGHPVRSRSRGLFSPVGSNAPHSNTAGGGAQALPPGATHGGKLLHMQATAGPPRSSVDLHATRTPMASSYGSGGGGAPSSGAGMPLTHGPRSRRSSSISGDSTDGMPAVNRQRAGTDPCVTIVGQSGGPQGATSAYLPTAGGLNSSGGGGGQGPLQSRESSRRVTGDTSRRAMLGAPDSKRAFATPQPDARSAKSATMFADRTAQHSSGGPRPMSRQQAFGAAAPGVLGPPGRSVQGPGLLDYGVRQRNY